MGAPPSYNSRIASNSLDGAVFFGNQAKPEIQVALRPTHALNFFVGDVAAHEHVNRAFLGIFGKLFVVGFYDLDAVNAEFVAISSAISTSKPLRSPFSM